LRNGAYTIGVLRSGDNTFVLAKGAVSYAAESGPV